MDKLKLRYLIREAIENVANVTSKFSVGDKVTTVDGDTACYNGRASFLYCRIRRNRNN